MVKLEKVNKYFNRHRANQIHIINNTSFELENSGLVAILGNSGSGKTTLLNVIGGLDKVNKGKIFINGKRISKKRIHTIDKIRNKNIGYVFQDYKLLENKSVFENVAITLRMIGIKNKKEIEKRVNDVLEAVKMYRYRNRPAKMLSGGEKQRVAIARAIVKNPNIVIADEPTGNLDSKNSLEIMDIIKSISKEKLVILVTHEVNLAKFYATRIIELQDGKIIKDYENKSQESLEYRLENKVYLKDFQNIESFDSNKIRATVYTNKHEDKTDVKLVIENGNILIEAPNNKIQIVDENSPIELVDSHYQKIKKENVYEYQYHIQENDKIKYKSIYGIIKAIKHGFKKIADYTVLKKILLVGFFASSMFVVYSISNIFATLDIRETDFINVNKNYLQLDVPKINVDDYLQYEQIEGIDYMLPGDSNISFQMKIDDYYQLSRYSLELTGSLVSSDIIDSKDLIVGTMPQNEYEIVVDKRVIDNMFSNTIIKRMGVKSIEELLNKKVSMENMKEFTIVGFSDTGTPSIFASKTMFINLISNSKKSFTSGIYIQNPYNENENQNKVMDYELFLDDITLTKGNWPENDYEVIVNKSNQYDMKLNKTIGEQVNGVELKVVGYYESKTNRQNYFVNNNTVKYDVITKSNGSMIYTNEKNRIFNQFRNEYRLNIVDCYARDRENYLTKIQEDIRDSIIMASITLIISFVEIYLMIRTSFLSRIKEIGTLRAIGVKRLDIYRMFLGEILAITTVSSMPGVLLMSYILGEISKVEYINRMFMINSTTIGLSMLIVYAFNILIGLMPLHRVLKKSPATILSRHDLE